MKKMIFSVALLLCTVAVFAAGIMTINTSCGIKRTYVYSNDLTIDQLKTIGLMINAQTCGTLQVAITKFVQN